MMKIIFFSAQPYDKEFFNQYNDSFGFELEFFETQLDSQTVGVITNADAICVFVNDKVDAAVVRHIAKKGVRIIALRCAGFNNVDLDAAREYNIHVCRVPAYSPEAVAEHAVAMILTLDRKIHKAYNRVREQNFSLNGLLGFDVHNKTIGVIGTGNIGKAFSKIMHGFGCRIVAFDVATDKNPEMSWLKYVTLTELLAQADIISLHCPLNEQTKHIINAEAIDLMKKGVMLINTSRGALIDTPAVIEGLKTAQIGYLGIDVYEQEETLFFRDLSEDIITDDIIQRLMSFPNVLVTAHQAFFTREAVTQIAIITLQNIQELLLKDNLLNKAALLC